MRLRLSSFLLKKELFLLPKKVKLDGCLLLLKIMYLDNVDFGAQSTCLTVEPRIAAFNHSIITTLSTMDKYKNAIEWSDMYGARELRPAWTVVYSRGDKYRDQDDSSSDSDDDGMADRFRYLAREHKHHIMKSLSAVSEHLLFSADMMHEKMIATHRKFRRMLKEKRHKAKVAKRKIEHRSDQGPSEQLNHPVHVGTMGVSSSLPLYVPSPANNVPARQIMKKRNNGDVNTSGCSLRTIFSDRITQFGNKTTVQTVNEEMLHIVSRMITQNCCLVTKAKELFPDVNAEDPGKQKQEVGAVSRSMEGTDIIKTRGIPITTDDPLTRTNIEGIDEGSSEMLAGKKSVGGTE